MEGREEGMKGEEEAAVDGREVMCVCERERERAREGGRERERERWGTKEKITYI